MKASEFYEKYWKVKNAKGEMVSPPVLKQEEKDFLDQISEMKPERIAMFFRKRRRSLTIDVGILKQQMEEQLPKYFYPANQPKLDKYGGYENEEAPPLK